MPAMSAEELFVSAARKCLSAGRKSLSVPRSLDLGAQVLAVDLGLKPALLYDSNAACAEQVQQYLSSLQSAQLVSKSLLTLDVDGNAVVVNPFAVRSNVEQLFGDGRVAVIDVRHSLDQPAVLSTVQGEVKKTAQDLLLVLEDLERLKGAEKPQYVAETSEGWNLCTVFGLLLGYPATYWFDQTVSHDNCLAMTPLLVTTASAVWQAGATSHRSCLYSFSVPAALVQELQTTLGHWTMCLRERFEKQHVLKDLEICQNTVILPSVCL